METKPDYVQDEITNPNKSKVNMNAKATYVPDEITNLALLTYIYIYMTCNTFFGVTARTRTWNHPNHAS